MTPDPRQIVQELGLDPLTVSAFDALSQRHGHAIWRILTSERSYVLKWLPETDGAVEVQGYRLLRALGVPTLPLYGSTDQALLLEDLGRSDTWRLAVENDTARPRVGRAVARWYRLLHDAGEALLAKGVRLSFLTRETDELNPDVILQTGQVLGLPDFPVWDLAADHIELLKAAVGRLSGTLNYNDFHWTNLALSRRKPGEPSAVVFDYHLLGIGMRYSDFRNVIGSLCGDASKAFRDAYGPTDPREETLDRPLATLHGLVVGARMPTFPRWAEDCRDRVISGDLKRDLAEAIGLAQSLCSTDHGCGLGL